MVAIVDWDGEKSTLIKSIVAADSFIIRSLVLDAVW